jgi:hypothetical protein
MVPLANPLFTTGGGIGPIRCHHQIKAVSLAGRGWGACLSTQDHRDGRIGLKALKQQGHQRAMAADPTDGSGAG